MMIIHVLRQYLLRIYSDCVSLLTVEGRALKCDCPGGKGIEG